MFLLRAAIKILHATGASFFINEDARRDGVAANFELAGLHCRRNQIIAGVEEARRIAAAPAVAAVVTLRKAVVILRQHGATPADDRYAGPSRRLLQQHLAATLARRRHMIFTTRQHVRIVIAAADADELINSVVIR